MMIFNLANCVEQDVPTVEWEEYCDESQLSEGTLEIVSIKGLESLKIVTRIEVTGKENQLREINEILRVQGRSTTIFLVTLDYERSGEVDLKVCSIDNDEDISEDLKTLCSKVAQLFPSADKLKWRYSTGEGVLVRGVY